MGRYPLHPLTRAALLSEPGFLGFDDYQDYTGLGGSYRQNPVTTLPNP